MKIKEYLLFVKYCDKILSIVQKIVILKGKNRNIKYGYEYYNQIVNNYFTEKTINSM